MISRDSFLEPLDLGDLADRVRTPELRDALYSLVLDYFGAEGLITGTGPKGDSPVELAWKVPGTAVTVHTGLPTEGELRALAAFAIFLVTSGTPPEALALTPLAGALGRFRKLRTQYGERSIVDALENVSPPTVDEIFLELYGKSCRHPDAGCRFMDGELSVCGVQRDQVHELAAWLVDQGVLRQLNPNDPVEYGIAI